MTVNSRLGRQIAEVIAALEFGKSGIALIGGLALASHNVVRATQDVDLLAEAELADAIEAKLAAHGYRRIHRSVDAANYLRSDERVDILFAHRPIARRLLERARTVDTPFGTLRVVSAEGLIGLKLQGFVNDAKRTQDLADIRALLSANRSTLDVVEVREYFQEEQPIVNGGGLSARSHRNGDPYVALDDLMVVVEALCAVWPSRTSTLPGAKLIL
jgi:hypothetical protein